MDLLLDIGGTNSRMGKVAGESVGGWVVWPTPHEYGEALGVLKTKIGEISGGGPVETTVVGIAGALDRQKKRVVRAPNLQSWVDRPLAEDIAKITGGKVVLENDAAVAALGEANVGAGRRHAIVVYVTVSTGIGGARVVNGKLDENYTGFEPGHMVISVGEKVGYWEDFASGTAMERVYGKKPWDIEDEEAWDNEARLVAIGLHNLTVVWSPELIVLGGGLTKSLDIKKILRFMEEMKFFPTLPEIKMAELEDKSGLYGARELI